MDKTWCVMNAEGETEYCDTYVKCKQYLYRFLRDAPLDTVMMLYTFEGHQAEFYKVSKTWQPV